MGGGGDTKKTLAQVEQELLRTLCVNANKFANPPHSLPGTVTTEDLQKILADASRQSFKAFYGYDFLGETSKPPSMSAGIPHAADELCNITTDEGTQIEGYVKQQILNSAKLQDVWIYDTACVDIVKQGKGLFETPTGNSWFVNNFGNVYNSPDRNKSSYKLDAEMMYCNAYLTIDGNTVKYTVLNFIGVFYEVLRPEKAVLNNLVGLLANSANKLLTGVGIPAQPLQSPPAVQDIEAILQKFCLDQFQKQNGFAFNFNQTKPPDIATNTTVPQIKGSNALCYLTDELKAAKDLGIYVDTKILSAMDLPPWMLAGPARTALVNQLTELLGTKTGNNWTQAPFGVSYNSAALIENSYKTTSVIAYTNASLTEGSVTVNVTLLNYMGVYYQIQSPNAAATQGLMNELCKNANNLLKNPIAINTPPTSQDLQNILDVFAPIQFQEMFGFPYLGVNSKPTDAAGTNPPFNNKSFLFLPPDQLADLQSYIDTSILAGLGLPQWAKDVTRPDLYKVAKDLAGRGKMNTWNYAKFTDVYANTPNPKGNSVKTTAIFVYSNATVVQNGQQVTATFMYYAGLYYGVSSNDPFGRAPKRSKRELIVY